MERCEIVGHINDGQDDYVELRRYSRKEWSLWNWDIEKKFTCKGKALAALTKFIEEDIPEAQKKRGSNDD